MGVSSGYWLRMQGDYDMRMIDRAVIEREVQVPEAS
jgi:plasmid maintenance system antidote protein VapI